MSIQTKHQNTGESLLVYLETFGCQMNVLDSELVLTELTRRGYQFTDNWHEADIILYNTCSVRELAEQKVWSRIGEVSVHKQEHPHIIMGILGCMAEQVGPKMIHKYPLINLLCGPSELDKLPHLLDQLLHTDVRFRTGARSAQIALQGNSLRRSGTIDKAKADRLELLDLSRSFTPQLYQGAAYVRITRGCNKFCSYCVVPHTRGPEVNRPPEHIIDECKRLVDAGIVEITLLGQTVNHYHYNPSQAAMTNGLLQSQLGRSRTSRTDPQTVTFAQLLWRIHESLPDLKRLRFVTSYPRDFGEDILQVMKDCPRICRYLHLPVQSGSNRLLKLMNRGYTAETYLDLIDKVRSYLPDCEIATDIICGFPTETEDDHQSTISLLQKVRCKNAFNFKYSPRPGTAAMEKYPDDIPDDIKKRRNNELIAVQSEISKEVHQAYIGRRLNVFVKSLSTKSMKATPNDNENTLETEKYPNPNSQNENPFADSPVGIMIQKPQLSARTTGDLIVCFDGNTNLIGKIIQVEITDAAAITLFGKLVS